MWDFRDGICLSNTSLADQVWEVPGSRPLHQQLSDTLEAVVHLQLLLVGWPCMGDDPSQLQRSGSDWRVYDAEQRGTDPHHVSWSPWGGKWGRRVQSGAALVWIWLLQARGPSWCVPAPEAAFNVPAVLGITAQVQGLYPRKQQGVHIAEQIRSWTETGAAQCKQLRGGKGICWYIPGSQWGCSGDGGWQKAGGCLL